MIVMTTGPVRFTGGLLGASVVVDVLRPGHAIVNVCVAGRPVIVDGHAETLEDGRVRMDDYTQSRLRNRGITIQQLDIYDDHIIVTARLPFIGSRQLTLSRHECIPSDDRCRK